MVDVRRVSGCAMAFRDEYQALQAVLDINTPSSFQQTSLPDFDFMKDNYIPLEEDIIERSIKKSENNLESKMYDTRIITLQDLLLTTDPDSKETSLNVEFLGYLSVFRPLPNYDPAQTLSSPPKP